MSRSTAEYLRHILDEANYLLEHSRELTLEQFVSDETLSRAFVRSLEVIGEATKNLPVEFRTQHDHIE